jgi:periplasmic copper chaperone A
MRRRSLLLLPFAATAAHAHSYEAGAIKIGHAWALPAPMGIDGQVFMPLLNTGTEPDSLVASRTDMASYIEIRAHNKYDILPLKEFYLEPGKPLAMRPTSKHLRVVGLNKPFVLGDKFMLVLDFLNAGEVEVEVHVEHAPGD